MAKTRIETALDASLPMYYATATYKTWARARIKAEKAIAKSKGTEHEWSLIGLAERMKRINPQLSVTDSALSQFLGPEDREPVPSNTTLMPALNKILKAAPPPVCDPTNQQEQIHDRIAANWSKMTPRMREALLALVADEDETD